MKKAILILMSFFILYENTIFCAAKSVSIPKGKEYYDRLLKVAAGIGNVDRVDEALDNGADELIAAFEEAAKNGNLNNIIEYILEKKKLNINSLILPPDSYFNTISPYDSQQTRDVKKIFLIYKNQIKKAFLNTILEIAIYMSYDHFLSYLINHPKIDINSVRGNSTVLMLAVEYNNISFIRQLLLKKGIDLNKTDLDDDSALQIAVKLRFIDIIKLLINAGADPFLVTNRILNESTDEIKQLVLQARTKYKLRKKFEEEEYSQRNVLQDTYAQEKKEIEEGFDLELRKIRDEQRQKKQLNQEEEQSRKELERQQRAEARVLYENLNPLKKVVSQETSSSSDQDDDYIHTAKSSVSSPKNAKLSAKTKQNKLSVDKIKEELLKIGYDHLFPQDRLLRDFLGYSNIVVDLKHIYNISLEVEDGALKFKGGHYELTINKLLNTNFVSFIWGKILKDDCRAYYLKSAIDDTEFLKTTFPERITPNKLMEILQNPANIEEIERKELKDKLIGIIAKLLNTMKVFILIDTKNSLLVTLMPITDGFVMK